MSFVWLESPAVIYARGFYLIGERPHALNCDGLAMSSRKHEAACRSFRADKVVRFVWRFGGAPTRCRLGDASLEIQADHYQDIKTEVEIVGCPEEQSFEFALIPGWSDVFISSIPEGATVSVDGKPAGNNPWGSLTLEWTNATSPPDHHNFTEQPIVDRGPYDYATVETVSTNPFDEEYEETKAGS